MIKAIASSLSSALQEVVVSDIEGHRAPDGGTTGRGRNGERSWWPVVRAWVAGLAVLAGLMLPLAAASPAAAGDGNPRAYVTNFNSDTVSVINTRTNTVAKTIPVGDGPRAWPSLRTAAAPTSATQRRHACQ